MADTDSPEATGCYKCGAEPGQPCRTATGRLAGEPHRPRRRAYVRRRQEAGTEPDTDSPILRAARAEAAARQEVPR